MLERQIAYGQMSEDDAKAYQPKILLMNDDNKVKN